MSIFIKRSAGGWLASTTRKGQKVSAEGDSSVEAHLALLEKLAPVKVQSTK